MNDRPFIMKDNAASVVALALWIKRAPVFDTFSLGQVDGDRSVSINLIDRRKPKREQIGQIICMGGPQSEAFKQAERIVRAQLGWATKEVSA